MADKYRNQNNPYNEDWDTSNNRYNRYNDYNQPDYDNTNYGSSDYKQKSYGNYNKTQYDNPYGRDYDSDYNRNDYSNRNYGNVNYGSDPYRRNDYNYNSNYYRDNDRSYPNAYNAGYQQNRGDERYRNDHNYRGRQRDWWDRTTDEISSWFGDEDAERRRRMDKVSGPHKGKGPKGYQRSDDRIQEDVNDRLGEDSFIDASEIEVKVNNHDVVLTGTVESREEKHRAEDIAESVSGVSNVENHIRVNRHDSSDYSSRERNRNNWI